MTMLKVLVLINRSFGTHEYIGDPLVEWTTKGVVMPVKTRGSLTCDVFFDHGFPRRCLGLSPLALYRLRVSRICFDNSASHMMCLSHLPRTITFKDTGERRGVFMDNSFAFTQTLKRDLSGVRLGGFLRVICELQIGNGGFKSVVILLLKATVFGCLVVRRFCHLQHNGVGRLGCANT